MPASAQTNTARDCAIAAGGRVEGNTLNCGYTPEKVAELLSAARADDQKQIATLNEALGTLSKESGLTEGAIRAVLTSLGEDQATIPHERLADALFAGIGQIVALRQGLTRQNNDAPDIAALKQRAIAELDAGHFTEADRLLEDIHAREHAVAEARAKAMAAARADWLASLQAEADTSALLARSALQQRNGALAVSRFEGGVRTLAPADAKPRWSYASDAAAALQQFGYSAGDNDALAGSIRIWKLALADVPRADNPIDWAMTRNSLGNALRELGEREGGTARLEDAIAAFRAALQELTRERVPLDWAQTQNNLGNALSILGERESGTARLEGAVAAYRAALQELTRDRVPLDWAMTQNNLGNALNGLGERESGTARLEEAVAAYRAALEERTRERVPLDWAATQYNLGAALWTLGQRESGTARLEEAVTAYRAALQERTRERVPLEWAATQTNLGAAL